MRRGAGFSTCRATVRGSPPSRPGRSRSRTPRARRPTALRHWGSHGWARSLTTTSGDGYSTVSSRRSPAPPPSSRFTARRSCGGSIGDSVRSPASRCWGPRGRGRPARCTSSRSRPIAPARSCSGRRRTYRPPRCVSARPARSPSAPPLPVGRISDVLGRRGAQVPRGAQLPLTPDHNFRRSCGRFAVEQSLRRLRSDYIDLLQLHNPALALIATADTYQVLEDLRAEGKIRFYGVSVHPPEEGLAAITVTRPDTVQIVYNIVRREAEHASFPPARAAAVRLIAPHPLA